MDLLFGLLLVFVFTWLLRNAVASTARQVSREEILKALKERGL